MQGNRAGVEAAIKGSDLYRYYREDPKRSVLVGLADAWENHKGISCLSMLMSDWTGGEKTVALHLLRRYVSPALSDLCMQALACQAG